MLSKYFGESGKLIESTFDQVEAMAKDRSKLVVVVIDEVETIASSRQRISSSGECNDGLRVSRHWLSNAPKHYHVGQLLICLRRLLINSLLRSTEFEVWPTSLFAARATSSKLS
jgi:SpoVK/Ycf46/Vps4 family AAA+-type ATPase